MDQIKIIRSPRRKRTVQAKKIDNVFHVYLPMGFSSADEQKWVNKMVDQWKTRERKHELNSDGMLQQRAEKLNQRYFQGKLEYEIHFAPKQKKRFGSCSPFSKMIRISNRIASMPHWVQDYVLMHELTHLWYPDHSSDFWKKVNEYPLTERARGYLIAVGLVDEDK